MRMTVCGLVLGAAMTLAPSTGWAQEGGPAQDTEVLVVATVHTQHRRNPNYTYEDVVRILDAFQPDVVCVEIRPEEFRREPYLKEMMLATVWGLAHGREVCGFDWYDGNARQLRAELEETPEYVEKARVLDSLESTNPVMRAFDEKYPDYWRANLGYRFYNGWDYNRYFEEAYRLSLSVYGDDPVNLNYESRNRRMVELAWPVIRDHQGQRVALVTGAEHKHYFDRDLGARPNVRVVALDDGLPLRAGSQHPAVAAFLEDDDDLDYYEDGFPRDTTLYYKGKVTGLLHGPDMDWLPDIVPERNIRLAEKVIGRWEASQPVTPHLLFDAGWYHFLNGDCEASLAQLRILAEAIEAGEVTDPFHTVYTYRNMGLCHDLLGNREAALAAYARARELARGTRTEANIELAIRDFETTPYARGRAREPFRR